MRCQLSSRMRIVVRVVIIVIIEVSGIMAASGCVVDEAVAWGSTSLSVRNKSLGPSDVYVTPCRLTKLGVQEERLRFSHWKNRLMTALGAEAKKGG